MQTPLNPSRDEIERFVRENAPTYLLDPEVVLQQIKTESSFNQAAVSPEGAIGLMQLEPATAAELRVDPHNWKQNLLGGMCYDRKLLLHFGELPKALAAYDYGPGNLQRKIDAHGDAWIEYLPPETKNYLRKILGLTIF